MNGKMNMSISQIFQKDGKPTAFVLFSEGRKSAEGKIPDCTIISNDGFSEKEVKALEPVSYTHLTLPTNREV